MVEINFIKIPIGVFQLAFKVLNPSDWRLQDFEALEELAESCRWIVAFEPCICRVWKVRIRWESWFFYLHETYSMFCRRLMQHGMIQDSQARLHVSVEFQLRFSSSFLPQPTLRLPSWLPSWLPSSLACSSAQQFPFSGPGFFPSRPRFPPSRPPFLSSVCRFAGPIDCIRLSTKDACEAPSATQLTDFCRMLDIGKVDADLNMKLFF